MQTSLFLDCNSRVFFREVFEIAQRVFTATAELEKKRQNGELAQANYRKAMRCERILEELADEPRLEKIPSKIS
jgi:hypothetical protein